MRHPLPVAVASLSILYGGALRGQSIDVGSSARLGSITFPTSGVALAQDDFIRGVLWLHSFEYERAASAFRSAQSKDQGFALAYWGEAMTYTHAIWNQQDVPSGRASLARLGPNPAARAAKAPTPRERDWLAAVEILYGDGPKARRDTLYERAMERLAGRYPDDVEAQAFYALAVMGLSQGLRNVPSYMRAGAIAQAIFEKHPDHPGAAHYVIHAFDDPAHAPLGLRAAQAYSKIAPSAGHAQHMTTHIFLALGMWPEVVKQNEVAQEASIGSADRSRWFAGHYTSWLGYALLQEGRFDDARAHLVLVQQNQGRSTRPDRTSALALMRAAWLTETERWSDSAAGWPLVSGSVPAYEVAFESFVQAVGALRAGRRTDAQRDLDALRGSIERARAAAQPVDPHVDVIAAQLGAILLDDAGRTDSAVALLRKTAAAEDTLPVDFGPPVVVKPTHELLGELLLRRGKAAEAQREFTRALEQGPMRLRALAGLARAADAAGDSSSAEQARSALRASLAKADPGLLDRLQRSPQ